MRSLVFFLITSLLSQLNAQSVWINEFHYDNAGIDTGEGVEVVVDTVQVDWRSLYVTGYNGSNSSTYGSERALVHADSTRIHNGYRFFWLAFPGLQNGPSDGLCLFRRDSLGDHSIQFISYEGSLQALNGPAAGLVSSDIGLAESSSTPIGYSLQLQGYNTIVSQHNWVSDTSSEGDLNRGQGFYLPVAMGSSDSYLKSSFNYQGPIDHTSYLDTSQPGLLFSKITIHDGRPNDADSLGTQVSQFRLSLDPPSRIKKIAVLWNADTIGLIPNPAYQNWVYPKHCVVPDNDSVELSFFVWFSDFQQDGQSFHIEVDEFQVTSNSSQLVETSLSLLDTSTHWIDVQATQLQLGIIPDTLFALIPSSFIKVWAVDSLGNLDTSYDKSLHYSLSPLSGFKDSVRFLEGLALETSLKLNAPERYYQLSVFNELGALSDSFYLVRPNYGPVLKITGVYDGPLQWGRPKGLELLCFDSVPDLSHYAIGIANNGLGSDGPEVILNKQSLSPGEFFYLCSDSLSFQSFFNFSPDQSHGLMNGNGDDAIELFYDSTGLFQGQEIRIDVFGDPDQVQGEWDYTDKWAYRVSGLWNRAFKAGDWYFSSKGKFENASQNHLVAQPFPSKSYQPMEREGDFIFDGRYWYPFAPEGDCTNKSIVLLKGSSRFDLNVQAKEFQLCENSVLELIQEARLEVRNKVLNDGSLILEHGTQLLLGDSLNYQGNGLFKIQGAIQVPDHRRFSFWTSPVQGTNFEKVFGGLSHKPTNALDWYTWSTLDQQWLACTDSTLMESGKGYISTPSIQSSPDREVNETRAFVGTPNYGKIFIQEPYEANDFILLGNPYPVPLDPSKFLAANPTLDGNIYYWDNSLPYASQAFAIWNQSFQLAAGPSSTAPDSSIAISQGFFVRAIASGDTILFHPDMQLFSDPYRYKSKESILISLKNTSQECQSAILFSGFSYSSFTKNCDALWKESGADLVIAPISDSLVYSIKGVDPIKMDTLALYCRLDTGLHTISINGTSPKQVYLVDLDLDLIWPISQFSYSFLSKTKETSKKRFKLILSARASDLNAKVTSSRNQEIQVYQIGRSLYWQSSQPLQRIVLLDTYGRFLMEEEMPSLTSGRFELKPEVGGQIYILQAIGDQSNYSLKTFIKP